MGTPYGQDPAELVALRRVLGWMLAGERGTAAATPDCSALEAGPLLAAVARHRLEMCLSPHAMALGLPGLVVEELQRRAGLQRLGGLALAGLARELIPRFEAAGVRALLFKGPLLAAQTCGDLGGRGSAAAYALPPAAFNDPSTGEDRSLAAGLASRLGRVQERLGP